MSRYRLAPNVAQEAALRDHCAHARFMWNLAMEQQSHWRPGRASAPGYLAQCRQLTQARAGHDWLREGVGGCQSATPMQSRSRISASRILVLIVPAGTPSRLATCP